MLRAKSLSLILIFFIFLIFPLFAAGTDQSQFSVPAYKSRKYETEGFVKIYVKEWLTNASDKNQNNGVWFDNKSFRIPERRIGDPNLDFFSVFIKSNLKNRITVTVTNTDFVNPRSDIKIKTGFKRWTQPFQNFKSGVVQEDLNYYIYEYKPTFQEINENTFIYYNSYRKVSCDSQGVIEGDFPEEYEVFGACSGLEVLPGIPSGYSQPKDSEVVFRCPISKEDYDRLPEGVEFVSTITISVGVE